MLKQTIIEIARSIPVDLGIIFLGAVPVTELRAAIPVAVAIGVEPWKAFFLAWIGNFLPVLPLLYLLEPIIKFLEKISFLRNIIEKILQRTRRKSSTVQKYGAIGLTLFVGIPAPGTGVWTGCLLAYLLGIRPSQVILAMMAGITLAGFLVTLATLGVVEITNFISLKTTLILLLLVVFLSIIFRSRKHAKRK